VLLDGKKSPAMKRKLRVTYAKKEQKKEIKGNVDAARARLKRKHSEKTSSVLEGKRAKKSKTGSGFKLGKKGGKMRLVEKK
jgi:hypothetical protein